MARTQRKIDKTTLRRLRTSYISTVVSMALVLLMLGLLGIIMMYSKRISNHVKENIGFTVIMKDNAKEVDILNFKKTLDVAGFVKASTYITKEQAAAELEKDLGRDFVKFLGYNPLQPSLEVFLKAEYTNNDSISLVEKKIMENPDVGEVVYVKSLIQTVNDNIRKITIILLVISFILFMIAITLINSTIRLSVFSKRFLIKSMQLIGATEGFIRRPFIIKGMIQGVYGAFLAMVMLSGLLYVLEKQIPELIEFNDIDMFLIVYGIMLVIGVLLALISNFFAVRKYLKIKTDYLYFY